MSLYISLFLFILVGLYLLARKTEEWVLVDSADFIIYCILVYVLVKVACCLL